MKIYNGEGLILGRLAAQVAKDALLGEEVRIVNCEKIVISGNKNYTYERAKTKRLRKGYPLKSQTHSRIPRLMVRRSIRGMLPFKAARGREAYKRILCYEGVPGEFASLEILNLPKAEAKKLPTLKYTTIGTICDHLRGRA